MQAHKGRHALGIAASLALGLAAAQAQAAEKAEVIHWWTSGGEHAAVKEFEKAFDAQGGKWVDAAVAGGGGDSARADGINRIIGGNPPAAMQFNTGKQFDELVSNGLLRNLDPLAKEYGWKDKINPVLLNAVSQDGHMYAVPVDIHSNIWLWYSPELLKKAGVEPPKTWDDLFTDLDALKKQGVIPLAQAGSAWTQALTFFNVMIGEGGKDLYMKVLKDRDVSAVKSPEFLKVAQTFGKLRDYVDSGMQGRQWNQATALVINDKAGFNFMGDWAKGEMELQNKVPGKDVGCIPALGHNTYWVGGDVFVFPKLNDKAEVKAQDLLAKVLLEPKVQLAFNEKKGAVPVLKDVPSQDMDQCAQQGLALLKKGDYVPSSDILISPDMSGSITDLAASFFTDKSQTPESFVNRFAQIIGG
ncbi:sugar ABC transporter substrate-binding protein [Thioclava sp. DLFJ5-1]|uniref:ABC transporter substrate-binding protein n=1 Tax=Thioclava sp. DLFJ5-1 TaxID=1915314 RepID=UPI0009962DF0|nr:ABC transporter substrate-binding protein [Thioclava sp. DLFJ5-1]OOY21931.1 sugar ABC transporter substrate-binding protein [Thioclava sp. DLFJ5-1]